ncbi:hypothetical protein [Galbibacter orientalis]|uniref:hypothetical protein n=1 Tax=Galbibacter orientalis TaxID=453852 RepID=UPI003080E1A6
MKNYNEIKSKWKKRNIPPTPETGLQNIIEKSAYLLKKQRISQLILGVTVMILVFFFFYISAYKNTQVFWGLSIMIGSLFVRIVLEFGSMAKKEKLPIYNPMKDYNKKLINYYNTRKRLHFIVTPFLFGVYILGFVWLLPSFKANLSYGFYRYILYSSIFIFATLGIFIGIQIRKELFILKQLKK